MSYKIIHTADWHLGQTFKQKSRTEEHLYFIDWLLKTIEIEQVNAVIIAGDIFDVANPSIEAMDLYHHFLVNAFKLNITVIVIGGNHDSAARLNTTGSLLKLINVHVVGGDINALGQIIPLKNNEGQIEAAVIAVPYLRDGDLRKIAEAESIKESKIAFTESVKLHYDNLLNQALNTYKNVPIIGTAHLYISGSSVSDSSKENMHAIGTLGQIPSYNFTNGYNYLAMGHIHKPQVVKHPENVVLKYAGSPIPLSFSERNDEKEITILTIENNNLIHQNLPIPTQRNLKRFKGNADELLAEIDNYKTLSTLTTWAELIITERVNFIEFNKKIDELAAQNNIEILEKILDVPKTENSSVREKFNAGTHNNPLDNITQIFTIKCEKAGLNEENINELMPLFEETLTIVQNKQE
ncbi:MAG: exonuclease subunit SbcD [Candidatus Methylacidiphilales bacterium]